MNITVNQYGDVSVLQSDLFRSKNTRFNASDVVSIERDWNIVIVSFFNGEVKKFDCVWLSDAENFERQIRGICDRFRPNRSVIVETTTYRNPDQELTVALGELVGVVIGAATEHYKKRRR